MWVSHAHILLTNLHSSDVVAAADVCASWVRLLLLETGRSGTVLAAGLEEQLGETGFCLQLKKGQGRHCLTTVCTCAHAMSFFQIVRHYICM